MKREDGKKKAIMNLVINASILDSKPTGVGIYTINIINEMAKLSDPGRYNIKIFSPGSRFFNVKENMEIKKIPRYVQRSEYKKFAGIFRFIWNQSLYAAASRGSDLCYSPTTHGSWLLKNQIITIHDLLAFHFPHQNKFQYYYYRYFLDKIIRHSKAVIAVSQSTKKDITKHLNYPADKIHVIYGGYDQSFFKPKPQDDDLIKRKYNIEKYILTVGATYPHKNIERLIISYSLLPDRLKKEYKLVVAGSREKYTHALMLLVKERDLQSNIVFTGYVSFDDLPYLYSGAAALVYPSLYEGFGLPPLEAMACGCPVVVSNISSLPEVCGDAAFYIDPYNVDDIANGIAKVLTDGILKEDLIRKGLERAKLFSWEKAARGILKVIESIA
jgi:glycosyltransferase involved in cell wall biosynthesis